MKVVVYKNEKESNERCISRFNKRVQSSRKLVKIREDRYHKRKPTRRYMRAAAKMRTYYRSLREKTKFY